MVSVTIIIEGGSEGGAFDKKGFVQLFGKVCAGQQPRVKMAHGRSKAMRVFLDHYADGLDVVLLVDSEEPCRHATGLEFLVATVAAPGVGDIAEAAADDVHLMVEAMESWFFADPEGVKSRVRHLDVALLEDEVRRRNGNTELIPKADALRIFRAATGGKYKKALHLEFVGRLDPERIAKASPMAAALFRRLRGDTPVWT
jgi:hypothetical protein